MTSPPVARATGVHESVRTLVLAVLVTGIVVFDPRDGHPGSRPKYLLVVAGAVAAAALVLGARRHERRRVTPLRGPLLALLAFASLATLGSDHGRTAVYGYPGSYDGLLTTASFAVLFVATARAYRRPDDVLRAVRVLWFGAGTGVLLFGLAQLVDRLVGADTGWDWARPEIAPWTIGSTVGNPNHLGALLAMLLPLAAVLAVVSRGRERRLFLAGMALAIVELGVTASRGAWAAVVVAAALLGLAFRKELRPHRQRVAVVAAATVALLAIVLVVLGAAGVTKVTPGDLARTGPGTTLDLRFEVWSTAWRVAGDHPVLGVGPDVFPLVFPAYMSERFMLLYGPFTIANGAHNVFLNTLANLGVGGLVAFLALLGTAGVSVKRAWERLDDRSRLLAAGLSAALVAYLVQACLNTQTVSLSLCFWVFLGWLVGVTFEPAKED